MRCIYFPNPQGDRAERLRCYAVDHELEVDMEVREVDQIGFIEYGRELLRQILRVLCADSEGNDCSDIAEDRGSDSFIQLLDVLMGENEVQAVLSGL